MLRLLRYSIVLFSLINATLIPAAPVNQLQESFKGWQQVRTNHFIFVYEEKDKQAVSELLDFCETEYTRITRYFDSYPKQIYCILRGRTDSANGFFSPMPLKIELNITAPNGPSLGAKTESWLKQVFIHEFTHYVHIVQQRDFWAGLASVFGPELAVVPMYSAPGWMIEGITTNLETRFTAGGRGRNPYFEIYYKAPILENKMFTLPQIAYNSAFPPSGRIYVGGYILVDYLMQQYGADVFPRIHREFINFPYLGPWNAIKKVTGKTAGTIYKNMVDALTNRYQDDRLIPSGKLLTPADYGNYSLPVITDYGWYLYRSTHSRTPALVCFDPDTGKEKVLLECLLTDNTSFTASSDGKDIFFASPVENPFHQAKPEEISDLYHLQLPSGRSEKLTVRAHLWQPALSPDGKQLVAVQGNGSYSRLVEVDQQTGALYTLYDPGEANIYNPVFSPDSHKLAFVMNVRGMQDIYLINDPAGIAGNPNGITALQVLPVMGTDFTGEYYPFFADNERLIFVSDHSGRLELWQVLPNRHELTLIGQDPVGVLAATMWRGNIVYRTYSTRGFCLKIKDASECLQEPEPWPTFEPYPTTIGSVRTPGLQPESIQSTASKPADEPSPTRQSASTTVPPILSGDILSFTEKQNRLISVTTDKIADIPFTDPAWPHLWLPYPSVNTLSSNHLTLGVGLMMYGRALLDETQWMSCLAYHPYERQPLFDFAWHRPFGPLFMSYQLTQSYNQKDDDYRQITSQLLQASLPLKYTYFWPQISVLSLSLGIGYTFAALSHNSFGFSDSFNLPADAYRHNLLFLPGLAWQYTRVGAVRDFYAPWKFVISGGMVVPLPVDNYYERTFDSYAVVSGQFPFFLPHQVIKLGAKTVYTSGQPENRFILITPRGNFSSDQEDQPGRSLFACDYLFTLALLDVPGPYNFNIQGLSGGVHLETAASWDPGRATWQFDRSLYAGCELTLMVNYADMGWPLGLGLAVRFDPLFSRPLDPGKDLCPYFFISLDSFRDNYRSGSPERFFLTKQHNL